MKFKPAFLLIEDNLIDQLVTRKLLKKVLDIDPVFVANNGLEGLQWIIKNKKICHSLIILLDIQMPIMNGFEFLDIFETLNEEIKNEIQIFVMSSTLDQEEIECIKDNIYVKDFLSKPFPIEEFKKQLTSNFLL